MARMILISCAICFAVAGLIGLALAEVEPSELTAMVDEGTSGAPSTAATASAPSEGAPALSPVETQPTASGPAAEAESDPLGAIERLVQSIRGGHWRLAVALVLSLLMLGLSKVRDRVSWFSGDRGGAILLGVLALTGAISTALATPATPLDWKLFVGALGVMWTACGGYVWVKRIIWPKDA